MKQNIRRGVFLQSPNLSRTKCQENYVSTSVEHLNALYSHYESRFEDILVLVIPSWITNLYGDINEMNVMIQEEYVELSTIEKLKIEYKRGYQKFWLQKSIPVAYPIL